MIIQELIDGPSDSLDNCPTFLANQVASYKYDLKLVYLAFMEHFRGQNISWDKYFQSFETFLSYAWRAVTVTDRQTGKPHIVVSHGSIVAFRKIIIEKHPNAYLDWPDVRLLVELVDPQEKKNRIGKQISNCAAYEGLLASHPTSTFSSFRLRVRQGDPHAIREVWDMRDRTFLAMEFYWGGEDDGICLEWGFAILCCNGLDHWPPNSKKDFRMGHYIVAEYVENKNKLINPSDYAFGESKIISKDNLPGLIRDTISTLASAVSYTVPNKLVFVAHSFEYKRKQLKIMNVVLPYNVMVIDTGVYEQRLFQAGCRGKMYQFKSAKMLKVDSESIYVEPKVDRDPMCQISLKNIFLTLKTNPVLPIPLQADFHPEKLGKNNGGVVPNVVPIEVPALLPNVMLHNTGNRSAMCLFALFAMLDPEGIEVPHLFSTTETGHATLSSKL